MEASETDLLGIEDSDFIAPALISKSWIIYNEESKIDPEEKLYLITWSPDPKELPDADFITQHMFNINILADYLKNCECGLFCVESTQMGNPHYHGWYQTSDDPKRESGRIAIMKTLNRFGDVKLTKSIGKYRINSYTKQGNCLYYYKDDVFGQQMNTITNPITKDCHDDTDWNGHRMFFVKKNARSFMSADTSEKINQREYYAKFYRKSI